MIKRLALLLTIVFIVQGGCASYKRDEILISRMKEGNYSQVRMQLNAKRTRNSTDRNFVLDRMKEVIASLADGTPQASEYTVDGLYDSLRMQGLNADKTVSAFLTTEMNARIWKGEPFEQAMAYCYIASFDGLHNDWGNVRAASENSLFLLRDFSGIVNAAIATEDSLVAENKKQRPANEDEAVRRRRLLIEQAAEIKKATNTPDDLGVEYERQVSDFELGYILKSIACRRLGLTAELDETLAGLSRIAPRLDVFANQIRNDNYNTVLVVDYGTGPLKYGAGMDNVIAMFKSTMPPDLQDDDRSLVISIGDQRQEFPIATNVDRLAQDLKWNNLEDMRKAKSYIGTGMMAAGAGVTAYGAHQQDAGTALAGAGMLLAGALMKASAAADTRHCEFLPQRTYVALLNVTDRAQRVDVMVDGVQDSRMLLTTLSPPTHGECQLRYLRLPMVAAPWTTNGQIVYSNDITGEAPGDQLPYILGGRCVRMPTQETLSAYQRSGYLRELALNDLLEIYREEGIVLADTAVDGGFGLHILEGGNWLFTPVPGSAGSLRLFGQEHSSYVPKSDRVKSLMQQLHPVQSAQAVLRN